MYIKNTGFTGDLICNVYDMSENLAEWTTEYCTTTNNPCTSRGGGIGIGGFTSNRQYWDTNGEFDNGDVGASFTGRLLLYVK